MQPDCEGHGDIAKSDFSGKCGFAENPLYLGPFHRSKGGQGENDDSEGMP